MEPGEHSMTTNTVKPERRNGDFIVAVQIRHGASVKHANCSLTYGWEPKCDTSHGQTLPCFKRTDVKQGAVLD